MAAPSILIVEHESVIANDLAITAQSLGYCVTGMASTGEEALSAVQRQRPDVVLLDLHLAGAFDGIETANGIRQFEVPVIFVLNYSDRDMVTKASEAGIAGYLLKPFGEQDLAVQLDIALFKSQASKALREREEQLRRANDELAQETTALRRLTEFTSRLWPKCTLAEGLPEMLAATMELVRADKGNIQLLTDAGVLVIAAQQGFDDAFTTFFREVSLQDDCACGRALRKGTRIIIEDVEADPEYAPFRHVAREARYRAVQSTPLLSSTGRPLGMLSTHWRSVHRPTQNELHRLDLYARLASDFIDRAKNDEALRQSEERLRALVTATSDVVYRMSPDWSEMRYLDGRQFIVDTVDPSHTWLTKYIPPDEQARVLRTIQDAIRTTTVFQLEHRVFRVDGSVGWTFSRAIPMRNTQGEIYEWIGAASDITERQQEQEALAEQARLLNLSNDAIIVRDIDGRVEYWNSGAEHLYGWTSAEAMGQRTYDLLQTEYTPSVDELNRRLREHGHVTAELTHRQKDGRRAIVLTRWVLDRQSLTGQSTVLETNTDITERRRAEEELRESESRFRELVERSPFGTYIVDSRLRIAHMNKAGQDGAFRNVRPVIGRDLGEAMRILWAEPVAAGIISEFRQTLETGEPYYSRNFMNRRADLGHTEGYEWELHRLTLPGGQYGVICYYYDSTKLRDTETALRQAQERLQQWNVELEHAVTQKTAELRASQERLRALATELNLAEQRERKRLAVELHDHLAQLLVLVRIRLGQAKRAPASRTLEMIDNADAVLNESLAYTRELVAQLCPLVLQEFGLPVALRWLGDQMKQYELTVFVRIEMPDEVPLPEEQAVLLFQSTRELLINAAKHAIAKEATVTLREHAGTLSITVADRGVGFEPGSSGKSDTSAKSSKFGLFSIRERMLALGGQFEIRSRIGEGTTATLTLPFQRTHDGLPSQATSSEETSQRVTLVESNGRSRVLIVDDHAMLRQGLRSVLEGYADIEVVGEASNGLEAVDMAAALHPSVILMDINLPIMNGIEATAKIKTRQPEIIVIGLSVTASPEAVDLMRTAGASCLLTKGAAVDQLYEAIHEGAKPA